MVLSWPRTRPPLHKRSGRPPGPPARSSPPFGTAGYATRRDLSSWSRVLFFALLALIVFGIVAIFGSIPHANIIWAVGGLVIFGGYTIFDFNRLRRAGRQSAVPIAASIFLDVLNVFLSFLQLFPGGRE
ncbi:MAG: Bax inhibitor-1 family protein [Solirubrobacterales bacterium]|nr:Bax inhibitor-1 family protein [Solirubrobacterales bacterium]